MAAFVFSIALLLVTLGDLHWLF